MFESAEDRAGRQLRARDKERVAVRVHRLAREGDYLLGGDCGKRIGGRRVETREVFHGDSGLPEEIPQPLVDGFEIRRDKCDIARAEMPQRAPFGIFRTSRWCSIRAISPAGRGRAVLNRMGTPSTTTTVRWSK